MRWIDKRFAELSLLELYAILSLRQQVFVVEQACAFLDADGCDPLCDHLWAEDSAVSQPATPAAAKATSPKASSGAAGALPPVPATGGIQAYLRILPALPDEVRIGRVVIAPAARGTGLGLKLMQRGLALARARYGPLQVRIGAQAHLERFYSRLGFVRASDNYDEDGIPHLTMLLPPGVA